MNKIKSILLLLSAGGLLLCSTPSYAVVLTQHPKLQAIADQLIADNLYSQAELNTIFDKATVQQSILDAMMNPAEYKFTWGKYRKIFLQEDRIHKGVEFWQQYKTELTRAEQEYGVPASIIVAIIGVESKFGEYRGKHKVLDSLVTLVTGYPRRSRFFASELKHFLILTKQNNLQAHEVFGSYAGAVGYPQFISSSYRNYAIDFSGDGKTDLIDQPIDAIGSVANYFVKNGWLSGQPVTSKPMKVVNSQLADKANRKRKIIYTASELRSLGANIGITIPADEKLNILMLNASETVPEQNSSYIVRAGDTVCEIAVRFSVSCKKLFSLNQLNERGSIFRGQKLKLPASSKETNTATNTEIKKSATNKTGQWTENKQGDESAEQPQFFFTHENFYVITRYNHSVLYAMAVYDLSTAIADAHSNQMTKVGIDAASLDAVPVIDVSVVEVPVMETPVIKAPVIKVPKKTEENAQ